MGRFGKQDLVYLAEDDVYLCPVGERLVYHFTNQENRLTLRRCRTAAPGPLAAGTAPSRGTAPRACSAGIPRWQQEPLLEAVQRRPDGYPERMRRRRETVEHSFGTIKCWTGYTHFQTNTLKRLGTGIALQVLADNLKRVMNVIGIGPPTAAMSAA